MNPTPELPPDSSRPWLNRNVAGMGLTSLLSDISHEMATTLLPGFLAVLGVSAAALGAIEGVADAVTSFTKLWAGWFSDRLERRKPLVVSGYGLTAGATGLLALASGWPLVLFARAAAWFGRGVRGPARNAILASSVPAEARGRAFGFERAGDTIGAVIGPLIGVALLAAMHGEAQASEAPFRMIFALTLIPGFAAALSFALLVRDSAHRPSAARPLRVALGQLPRPFRRLLWGVGIFGMGDFAHTLMILAATQLLAPREGLARAAEIAGLLYVAHNVFYAAAAYPFGALSDRIGRRGLLALGYGAGAATAAGFAAAFAWNTRSIELLLALFALGGIYVAGEEALESALVADLAQSGAHGTAYGALGAVNGVGDFVASALVGVLWTFVSPVVAFAYAAVLMAAGAVFIGSVRMKQS